MAMAAKAKKLGGRGGGMGVGKLADQHAI